MRYLNDLSFSRGRLNRTISPRDSMRNPRYPEQYYDLGARALDLVLFASQLCAKPHFPRILDLPCGYGRVVTPQEVCAMITAATRVALAQLAVLEPSCRISIGGNTLIQSSTRCRRKAMAAAPSI